jgi:4a-hydroxytetrahydrobiopterin dehydratase
MELLKEEQIIAELAASPGWSRQGSQISRTTQRRDFRDAILFVGAVAYHAEQANHHPDILIQWNRVTLTLSTHSAGGLTEADFAMARLITTLA